MVSSAGSREAEPHRPTGSPLALARSVRSKLMPKDRESLKKEAEKLDLLFSRRPAATEKALVASEIGYMRRQLLGDRRKVNVTYPVNPPYAFVHIRFDPDGDEWVYNCLEPTLEEGEALQILTIRDKMESIMGQEELPFTGRIGMEQSPELRKYLESRFVTVLDIYDIEVPVRRRPVLLYYLTRDFIGMGRADPVLRDPFLEDISCLGPGVPLYVFHRVFGSIRSNIVYEGEFELNKYVLRLAQISGKHVSIYQPILDATLRDGSRVNLTLGTEVTRKGSTFSIRKFTQDPISPIDLLRFGSVSTAELAYLWTLIENHRSVLISGGTASGKTTLLNAISMFIRPEDKIVSIEDTPEIHMDHQNWIQSVARSGYGMGGGASGVSGISGLGGRGVKAAGSVTLFDLLVAALRQRPEYVIVGEVRGVEAFTLFQAISVGHASMSTVHAGSIGELIHRIENEPMNIPRVLFQALDTVVFPAQVAVREVRVRRTTVITEVLEVDPVTNELLTNEVFRWDPVGDSFTYLGRSFVLEKISRMSGKPVAALVESMAQKDRYLTLMNELNMTYFKDVSRAIAQYYVDAPGATRDLEIKASQN